MLLKILHQTDYLKTLWQFLANFLQHMHRNGHNCSFIHERTGVFAIFLLHMCRKTAA